jgi:hypothetical protein
MPLANTQVPASPNVPQLPGVPVLAQINQVINNIAIAVADAELITGFFLPPQWGLFFNGFPSIIADSVISVGYRSESRISNAPQEEGGFASYNKVILPDEGRVVFAQGGTPEARSTLISTLFAAKSSLNLFTLVTPDQTVPNVNVVRIDYERSQRSGAGMLLVDVWLEQVNIVGAPQFSNTAAASGANPTNGGTVQSSTPNGAQLPAAGGLT